VQRFKVNAHAGNIKIVRTILFDSDIKLQVVIRWRGARTENDELAHDKGEWVSGFAKRAEG